MLLSPRTIQQLRIIHPWKERHTVNGLSAGASLVGYDITIDHAAMLVAGLTTLVVSHEHFALPAFVAGTVRDKSTRKRQGISVGNPFIEPGWQGFLTLGLVWNPLPGEKNEFFLINPNEPIAQVTFELCEAAETYVGKYQNQGQQPVAAILEHG